MHSILVSEPEPAPTAVRQPVPLLAVEGLKVHFYTRDGVVRAVDGVDFQVAPGQTLGIVGESGSGKTVSSLTLLRLAPPPARIVAGRVMFEGEDLLTQTEKRLAQIRGRRMAMIFQNPATSLNPILSIGQQLTEILRWHTDFSRAAALDRAADLLALVGISDPAARLRQYPHELSGGMKQRVGIARALLCEPALLLADEPTTALDVTIQAQILDLLADLRKRLAMSMVLVTHDMGVVARMADRITVMYAGRVCETADASTIFNAPQHPYTRALLASVLTPEPGLGVPDVGLGDAYPDPANIPPGCRFHPRCPDVVAACRDRVPVPRVGGDRMVECLLAEPG